jgi:hypothetical protein
MPKKRARVNKKLTFYQEVRRGAKQEKDLQRRAFLEEAGLVFVPLKPSKTVSLAQKKARVRHFFPNFVDYNRMTGTRKALRVPKDQKGIYIPRDIAGPNASLSFDRKGNFSVKGKGGPRTEFVKLSPKELKTVRAMGKKNYEKGIAELIERHAKDLGPNDTLQPEGPDGVNFGAYGGSNKRVQKVLVKWMNAYAPTIAPRKGSRNKTWLIGFKILRRK